MVKKRGIIRFVNKGRGYTFIDLIVLTVILCIAGGLLWQVLGDRGEDARVEVANRALIRLSDALALYKLDNHFYPSTEQGLEALLKKPETEPVPQNFREGGYIKRGRLPIEPWGGTYEYVARANNRKYTLKALGGDRAEGGRGYAADIVIDSEQPSFAASN